MRIIVTGATGFIGRRIVAELRARSVETLAVSQKEWIGDDTTCIAVDSYEHCPEGDVVIHCAEPAAAAPEDGDAYIGRNAGVARILAHKRFGNMVYLSSALVYDDTHPGLRRPDDPLLPTSVYTRSKAQCEQVVRESDGAVIRLSNVYGPRMHRGTVMRDVLDAMRGEGPLIVRNAASVRDFLWIDDTAAGIADIALAGARGVFNLGTGVGTSVGELARLMLDLAGQPEREVRSQANGEIASRIVLDIAGTVAACGWRPRTALDNGVAMLLEIPVHET
jgi:UDP-glucose 4-epimerase